MRRRPKVVTIVGARPQLVKAAALSRPLRERAREVLVHTGQHYDPEMSDVFFEELRLPAPDHHLGVGSGSHGRMTGRMLAAIETVLIAETPRLVVVLGDTNSTLAGALAAAKLGLPVAHVEAGLRSFDTAMPEEVNRRLTDHCSRLLFCPTPTAVENLAREGIRRGVHRVGDVMRDALLDNLAAARRLPLPEGVQARAYFLATVHRQDNTDDPQRLVAILDALDALPLPVLLPLHPRTRKRVRASSWSPRGAVRFTPPLSFLKMLRLQCEARAILTDSGGVQKEAFIIGTPCITLRDTTEWLETIESGANELVGADPRRIAAAVGRLDRPGRPLRASRIYGTGRAGKRIADRIARFLRIDGERPTVRRSEKRL